MQQINSTHLFNEAQKYMPGGVNSPVRAFNSVGGNPIFFERAQGAHVIDVDKTSYIDYVGSWGPMILGHQDPDVIKDVHTAVDKALSFGAPTAIETVLAEKICTLFSSIEKVRMVSSGTEATMTAIRLARAFTKRDLIVKFEGGYHGHSDGLLIKTGSGALSLGYPSSLGIPKGTSQHTLNLPYNDIEMLRQAFAQYGDQIAAIIVEPIAGNMGCVLPIPGFLEEIRKLCDQYDALCIFDEVITGFRVHLNGAQGYYNIKPDLTTLGKIIGGGMPVGAIGGPAAIMDQLAPLGAVYQAGTLSGNPVAMQAGLSTLNKLSQPGFYAQLEKQTYQLVTGIQKHANKHNIPLCINSAPGLFSFFFTEQPEITTFEQVMQCNQEQFKIFYHAMLKERIYFAPSAFECAFISIQHNENIIHQTLNAFDTVFKNLS